MDMLRHPLWHEIDSSPSTVAANSPEWIAAAVISPWTGHSEEHLQGVVINCYSPTYTHIYIYINTRHIGGIYCPRKRIFIKQLFYLLLNILRAIDDANNSSYLLLRQTEWPLKVWQFLNQFRFEQRPKLCCVHNTKTSSHNMATVGQFVKFYKRRRNVDKRLDRFFLLDEFHKLWINFSSFCRLCTTLDGSCSFCSRCFVEILNINRVAF